MALVDARVLKGPGHCTWRVLLPPRVGGRRMGMAVAAIDMAAKRARFERVVRVNTQVGVAAERM